MATARWRLGLTCGQYVCAERYEGRGRKGPPLVRHAAGGSARGPRDHLRLARLHAGPAAVTRHSQEARKPDRSSSEPPPPPHMFLCDAPHLSPPAPLCVVACDVGRATAMMCAGSKGGQRQAPWLRGALGARPPLLAEQRFAHLLSPRQQQQQQQASWSGRHRLKLLGVAGLGQPGPACDRLAGTTQHNRCVVTYIAIQL